MVRRPKPKAVVIAWPRTVRPPMAVAREAAEAGSTAAEAVVASIQT
jgi:hypothetical protein